VVTPGSSSATSFTRHTSFGTSPPSFREPEAYLDREPAPHGFAYSPVDIAHGRCHAPDARFILLPIKRNLFGHISSHSRMIVWLRQDARAVFALVESAGVYKAGLI